MEDMMMSITLIAFILIPFALGCGILFYLLKWLRKKSKE